MQKAASFLIQVLKLLIDHTPYCHDTWIAGRPICRCERRRMQEFGLNLIVLSCSPWHLLQGIVHVVCRAQFIRVVERAAPLPSMMTPDVPTTAIVTGTCQAWANLPCATWIARLLVIYGYKEFTVIATLLQSIKCHAVNWHGEQHKCTNPCTI